MPLFKSPVVATIVILLSGIVFYLSNTKGLFG
jgi:hypothetical protein